MIEKYTRAAPARGGCERTRLGGGRVRPEPQAARAEYEENAQ